MYVRALTAEQINSAVDFSGVYDPSRVAAVWSGSSHSIDAGALGLGDEFRVRLTLGTLGDTAHTCEMVKAPGQVLASVFVDCLNGSGVLCIKYFTNNGTTSFQMMHLNGDVLSNYSGVYEIKKVEVVG